MHTVGIGVQRDEKGNIAGPMGGAKILVIETRNPDRCHNSRRGNKSLR